MTKKESWALASWKPTKIAFDIGGVLSKYPHIFRPLISLLTYHGNPPRCEVFFISDMHPADKICKLLDLNEIDYDAGNVYSADYEQHGEMCKAKLCELLEIDIIIDDFPGYVAAGKHVRLLVMPEPDEPYYHDDWKTDGTEGKF